MKKIIIIAGLVFSFSILASAQVTDLGDCLNGADLANSMAVTLCQTYLDQGDPVGYAQCQNDAQTNYQAAQASCLHDFPIMTLRKDYKREMFDYLGIRHYHRVFMAGA